MAKGIKQLYGYPLIDQTARNDIKNNYQKKTDENLQTTDKTIVGGINEVLSKYKDIIIDPTLFGVIPDTDEDMGLSISNMINDINDNKIIKFKKGRYKVNPTQEFGEGKEKYVCGIKIDNKKNLTILFEDGCEFYMDIQPNKNKVNTQNYHMIVIENSSNILIENGTFTGDSILRYNDNANTYDGEWGYGIVINNNCENISIKNCLMHYFFGDGINIGMLKYYDNILEPKKVTIENCSLIGNRRHNMTVDCCVALLLKNNYFEKENTYNVSYKGHNIDFEQIKVEQKIQNIIVENNTFKNGMVTGVYRGGKNFKFNNNNFYEASLRTDGISKLVIINNIFDKRTAKEIDGTIHVQGYENRVSENITISNNIITNSNIGIIVNTSIDVLINNNTLSNNDNEIRYPAICLDGECNNIVISNNNISNFGSTKIITEYNAAIAVQKNSSNIIIDKNTILDSGNIGINCYSKKTKITNNRIIKSKNYGILITPLDPVYIKSNYLEDNIGEWQIFSNKNDFGGIISNNIIRCYNPNNDNNYPIGCIFVKNATLKPLVINNDCTNGATTKTFGDSVITNQGNILINNEYGDTDGQVEKLKLNKHSRNINIGKNNSIIELIKVKANLYPSFAINKNLVWKAKDDSKIELVQNGMECTIKAKSAGSTILTCTSSDKSKGTISDSCYFKITNNVQPIFKVNIDSMDDGKLKDNINNIEATVTGNPTVTDRGIYFDIFSKFLFNISSLDLQNKDRTLVLNIIPDQLLDRSSCVIAFGEDWNYGVCTTAYITDEKLTMAHGLNADFTNNTVGDTNGESHINRLDSNPVKNEKYEIIISENATTNKIKWYINGKLIQDGESTLRNPLSIGNYDGSNRFIGWYESIELYDIYYDTYDDFKNRNN